MKGQRARLIAERGNQRESLELLQAYKVLDEEILAYAINPVTNELVTASHDKLRLYSLNENCLLSDYAIPRTVFHDQNKPAYKVRAIQPVVLAGLWVLITSKKQIVPFTRHLVPGRPFELEENIEEVVVNQRDEVTYSSTSGHLHNDG